MKRRKSSFWIPCLLAQALSLTALAQKPTAPTGQSNPASLSVLQLKMELQGEFLYRFVSKEAGSAAPAPLPTPTGGVVALPIPASVKPDDSQLEIYDNTRGNLARVRIDLKAVTTIGESAFKFVQAVYVPVQSAGKPVTNVQVSLNTADKKYQSTWLLKPSDNGIARFESVPMTEPIIIAVSYAANPPKSVTETLPRAHGADGHHREPIIVDWADVKTIAVTNAPVSPSSSANQGGNGTPIALPSPAPDPASSSNGLFGSLVGLLFVGGAGYGIWRAYQNGKLKDVLDKLGINTAVNADPEPIPNPFTKAQQPPLQAITEGTADPFSGSGGAGYNGSAVAPPVLSTVPRLIGSVGTYQGVIFDLNSSSVIIGRDASNGVPLPNDTNASRRHATLEARSGQFTITDNGSSNGTLVNGVKILTAAPHPIHSGDEIQIGMTRFRFEA